jgi:hypothetical protein
MLGVVHVIRCLRPGFGHSKRGVTEFPRQWRCRGTSRTGHFGQPELRHVFCLVGGGHGGGGHPRVRVG